MSVPKLRFKEFNGEWLSSNLGEISDIKTGPFGSTLHQEDYVDIGTPIITVEHLGEIGITNQNLPLVSDADKTRLKSYLLKTGDLAFSRVGSVDRCAIVTEKENGWLFSGRILRVRPNNELIDSKNLMYALKTEDAQYRIRSVAVGQTMPSLNTEILKNFPIILSNSKNEQTKIASFLSAVDEKISQLTQKHQLLSQYKQGMMQKLFSQQIRFKADDGSEFGEWVKKKLVELTSWSSGGTPAKDYDEYWNGDIPLISGASMHTQKLFESDVTITELGLKKGSKLAPKDSILILVRGSMLFKKIPIGLTLKDVAFNQDVKCIQPNKKLDSAYLFQWLLAKEHTIQNKVTSTGIGAGKLDTADLQNLEFMQPTLEEQTKIANFLSSIDQKIEVVAQQIEQAKQWKKGLLQQMFV